MRREGGTNDLPKIAPDICLSSSFHSISIQKQSLKGLRRRKSITEIHQRRFKRSKKYKRKFRFWVTRARPILLRFLD